MLLFFFQRTAGTAHVGKADEKPIGLEISSGKRGDALERPREHLGNFWPPRRAPPRWTEVELGLRDTCGRIPACPALGALGPLVSPLEKLAQRAALRRASLTAAAPPPCRSAGRRQAPSRGSCCSSCPSASWATRTQKREAFSIFCSGVPPMLIDCVARPSLEPSLAACRRGSRPNRM